MTEDRSENSAELRKIRSVILRSPESGDEVIGPVVQQADTDDQLIELWLHGRPKNTQTAYGREIVRFMDWVKKPLRTVKLGDVQAFADELSDSLKESSLHRALTAVKSLFAFGFRLGYLSFDVGRAMKLPTFRDELADRILGETDVLRIISLEPQPRNRALLLTLYAGGFRVSELCSLKWCHLQERDSAGQITVFGKGGKTRTVLMPQSVWEAVMKLRDSDSSEAPVFRSRKNGHLDESAVWRIVKKAAERAGIDKNVSCHWFRHAHASHALDRNCPIHLVQATLGHASISTTGRYLHARPTDSSGNYLRT
ncbi:tyrosine-type recombinase/integrase [Rubinisphaera brasiliensis]|uniref:Integrase family protein n=1 Tax=Rubinisphaera brasiliensis (strain ATCC 49424 / DSM 5305 / JCM 21570 / IAM 15109 / NBRC 103401 / IFAM 1448) TaxID=756272 RepID=F0SJ33_RUBBR|nr:tyrosine-type recombinase/integrase [Rubinisphaera brasiliensis]ADY58575.1 integrase family protein [Rubinisphaera brasiliensis DSM 5305]